ncbi:MAG TPA: hypothetical protein VH442_05620 [Micromonosporaceae bacterium]
MSVLNGRVQHSPQLPWWLPTVPIALMAAFIRPDEIVEPAGALQLPLLTGDHADQLVTDF